MPMVYDNDTFEMPKRTRIVMQKFRIITFAVVAIIIVFVIAIIVSAQYVAHDCLAKWKLFVLSTKNGFSGSMRARGIRYIVFMVVILV